MTNNNKEQIVRESPRLFQCARCFVQVKICTTCDRGNIYCSKACSIPAKKASHCAASKRYQQSSRGKQNHARCQQRYREKQLAKIKAKFKEVIDQGSFPKPHELSSPVIDEADHFPVEKPMVCDFCKRKCYPYARWNFLNHYRRIRMDSSSSSMAFRGLDPVIEPKRRKNWHDDNT